MLANRDASFAFTTSPATEGLLSLDPHDGGNYASGIAGDGPLIGSKFGISASTLAHYLAPVAVTPKTMATLTEATAEAIWCPGYWVALDCDELAAGLDLMVSDHGFNRGAPASARVLQRVCAAGVDGWVGTKTLAAANAWLAATHIPTASVAAIRRVQAELGVPADGSVGPVTSAALHAHANGSAMIALAQLADAQLADYRTLPQWSLYGAGWTNRVWNRLIAAIKLMLSAPAVAPSGGNIITQAQIDALVAVEASLRTLAASLPRGPPPR